MQWVPTNFFPKIPEIDLRRFSLQFSLGVIVAIHENFKTFQLRIYQKTFNISRNVSNVTILFIGINVEIMKLSADMHLIIEYFVWEEIFAIYPMGTHGLPIFKWVTHGRPMQWSAYKPLFWNKICTRYDVFECILSLLFLFFHNFKNSRLWAVIFETFFKRFYTAFSHWNDNNNCR